MWALVNALTYLPQLRQDFRKHPLKWTNDKGVYRLLKQWTGVHFVSEWHSWLIYSYLCRTLMVWWQYSSFKINERFVTEHWVGDPTGKPQRFDTILRCFCFVSQVQRLLMQIIPVYWMQMKGSFDILQTNFPPLIWHRKFIKLHICGHLSDLN